jgi:hypothetical protein
MCKTIFTKNNKTKYIADTNYIVEQGYSNLPIVPFSVGIFNPEAALRRNAKWERMTKLQVNKDTR